MFRETLQRLTPEQIEPYKLKAARLLNVSPDSITASQWDEQFSNTGGPSRNKGAVVGRAFSWFEVLGFESSETQAKVKCCYLPTETWDVWNGVLDAGPWNRENPFAET